MVDMSIKPVKSEISIGGSKFQIGYPMLALMELEDKFNTVDEAFKKLEEGKLKVLVDFINIGVRIYNKDFKIEEYLINVTSADIIKLREDVINAIISGLPKVDEKK
jgi:hypothetical protein